MTTLMRIGRIALVSGSMLAGCSATQVVVVDASAEGGLIRVRGPEPNAATHEYLSKACPTGYRIVAQDEDAAARAVDLGNVGVSTSAVVEVTYRCEQRTAVPRRSASAD